MITNKILASTFGCEDIQTAHRGVEKNTSILQQASNGWSLESEQLLSSILVAATGAVHDGGMMDGKMKATANANISSNAISSLIKKYATESVAYATLPTEVKNVCSVPANEFFASKKEFNAASTSDEKFKAKYKMDQSKAALESSLWSVFSGIKDLNKSKLTAFRTMGNEDAYSALGKAYAPTGAVKGLESAGMEDSSLSTYADQIYVPKISVFNTWLNIASTIMPKVQKTKTVLNEICEIPVSTKHMIMMEKDDEGNVIAEHKREDLYANMDMSTVSPNLDQMRTRTLTLTAAEFNVHKDLHKDPLVSHDNASFLKYNEHIGPQLTVTSFSTADGKKYDGEIHDIRAGLVQGPTLGELDTKGKVIPYTPDATKPGEVYNLVFDWDVQNTRLFFTYTKTVAEMSDIASISFKCNMRDVEQTLKSRIAFRIKEERTVLATPEIDRYAIPVIESENEYLNERGSANHLNKIIELTSEYTQNKKESRWIKDYRKMKTLLKAAEAAMTPDSKTGNGNLYVSQTIDLNTLSETRKPESIAFYLGNNLNIIKDKFATLANTHYDVQLSIFAGTLSLNVIAQCFESITGDITEDSDGKYLGIAQTDRVKAITFGNTPDAPVQAIVVGTDKNDFKAKGKTDEGALIETGDIEYDFEIIPSYKDENIKTTLFVNQPTKVISGTQYRAGEFPLIPAIIIHEGYKLNILRPAAGDLKITGVGFRCCAD